MTYSNKINNLFLRLFKIEFLDLMLKLTKVQGFFQILSNSRFYQVFFCQNYQILGNQGPGIPDFNRTPGFLAIKIKGIQQFENMKF